jgi:spore coat protein U-like protein
MWEVWAAHQVTTTASASIEADPGGPIDTAFTAYRKVLATVTPHGTVSLNCTVPVSSAASLDGGATPNGAVTRDGTDPWVGQAEVWVTYLVVSRDSLGDPWQVAMTETSQ